MLLCCLCGHDFGENLAGNNIYESLKSLHPARDFMPICDRCFEETWEEIDKFEFEGPDLIFTDPELVNDRIFQSKGYKTKR